MIKQMFLFKSGVTNGTIDLDTNPALKDGTPIYDLDLATMEDKPWKKPGADLMKVF
uniref:Pre-mRNA 3'-end-processing factor FIP1 n=1 Tax=Meloidogyne incognita TaxID=6306 RepID=A0A914L124_MELIC